MPIRRQDPPAPAPAPQPNAQGKPKPNEQPTGDYTHGHPGVPPKQKAKAR